MEEVVIVSDGDVLCVPKLFAQTETQRRWLYQDRFTGCNPALEALALKGWQQYSSTPPTPYYATLVGRFRIRFRRFWWDHPYLTAIARKYTPIRNLVFWLSYGRRVS